MIKQITPAQLNDEMKSCYEGWLEYFKKAVDSQPFVPYTDFQGEDKNMLALRSKENFISWFGQPPGLPQQPYRDECFYARELTWLSMWCQPKTVVEFGTNKGISSLILASLNAQATVHSVDIRDEVPMAKHCPNIIFYHEDSKNFKMDEVNLCFVDGDHSKDAVWNDSLRAWANRPQEGRWVIIWHDYMDSEEMRGLKMAIHRFSGLVRKVVYKFEDSATVWMTNED